MSNDLARDQREGAKELDIAGFDLEFHTGSSQMR